MKFGLHSVNLHTCGYPDAAARIGRAAEAAGFESLWVADHVVLPDPPVAGRPMAPDDDTQKVVAALRETAKKQSRPAELGRLEISITPPRVRHSGRGDARCVRGGRCRSTHLEA